MGTTRITWPDGTTRTTTTIGGIAAHRTTTCTAPCRPRMPRLQIWMQDQAVGMGPHTTILILQGRMGVAERVRRAERVWVVAVPVADAAVLVVVVAAVVVAAAVVAAVAAAGRPACSAADGLRCLSAPRT